MIHALITGRLLRDPDLRIGPSGKENCNFLLSVPMVKGDPVIVGGIAFEGNAVTIAKLSQGDPMSVSGTLKPTTWTDKQTGETKHGLNVTVSRSLSIEKQL